ncbi:uncharacterized protein A4U43_C10F2450 [Asparagus officinalis]|uniref:Uncharacterized protein n=1 Tax=Asparagus officinalis TaxID=4686 RepID=A0A5P1E039_ASPOF|nr:uncharacterized protein A4U43_C10F2450 [Asparagus officinalis]
MEDDSYERDYYHDGDEGIEMECQRQKSEVEMHIDVKREAYDHYMDMLLKRAYEITSEQDDSESTED